MARLDICRLVPSLPAGIHSPGKNLLELPQVGCVDLALRAAGQVICQVRLL